MRLVPYASLPKQSTYATKPLSSYCYSRNNAKFPISHATFSEATLQATNKSVHYAGLTMRYHIMGIAMTATENIIVRGATAASDVILFADTIMCFDQS